MRAGLLGRVSRVAAACRVRLARRMSTARMPARRGIALHADVPHGERRDSGPERVIRRTDAWLASRLPGHPFAPAAFGSRSQSQVLARLPCQPPADPFRCFHGGGPRSASRLRKSNGESSAPPLAPGRADVRVRPGDRDRETHQGGRGAGLAGDLGGELLSDLPPSRARHAATELRVGRGLVDRPPRWMTDGHCSFGGLTSPTDGHG